MPKRVVFIVGTLHAGGIERLVIDWCLYLQQGNIWRPEVICVLKKSGIFLDTLLEKNIPVHECLLKNKGFTFRLSRLLKQIKPDVIHSQVAFSMPWQVLAAKLAGVKKNIFTQHNDYQNWNRGWAKIRIWFYFKLFFPWINHYTCVSEKVKESLARLAGINPHSLKVIPNGVNTDRFHPDLVLRNNFRQKIHLPESAFLLGMVGRFSQQKGHVYLLEALQKLVSEQNIYLILIGTGELKDELEQLVRQYEIKERIIFYGSTSEVEKILPAFDCFILSSLWEGMPLALLEAMACGLPVIGTDVAGTREVIQHNINGLLIPSADSSAIAEAVLDICQHPEKAEHLASEAFKTVHTYYSLSRNVEEYQALYEA